MKRRRWQLLVWLAAGAFVLVLLARTFVADLYRVQSGSMEPTIHGVDETGEWVLVRYTGAADLERFDLAVVYRGEGKPIVKRVVGLPGENVQVRDGDLFVDGARVAHHVPRPPLIPIFDAALAGEDDWAAFAADPDSWTRDGRTWRLDNYEPHSDPTDSLRWNAGVDDGYLLPDGTRVVGKRDVRDAGVEFELEWIELDGELHVELREAGDCFRARIVPIAYSRNQVEHAFEVTVERWRLRLTTSGTETREELVDRELLAEGEVPHEFGARVPVHVSNVDDALYVEVGELALVAAYTDENRELEGASVAPGATVGSRVAIGGVSAQVVVHDLRVLRDLAWISRGDFANERPLSLGPGELFLLGDNSAHSLDGRTWGPTRLADVLGRPTAVVWPRDRARRLEGPRWTRVDRRPGD